MVNRLKAKDVIKVKNELFGDSMKVDKLYMQDHQLKRFFDEGKLEIMENGNYKVKDDPNSKELIPMSKMNNVTIIDFELEEE